jgi:hypothetical protein
MLKTARVVEAALLNDGKRRSAVEGERKDKDAGHHLENVKKKSGEERRSAKKGAEGGGREVEVEVK